MSTEKNLTIGRTGKRPRGERERGKDTFKESQGAYGTRSNVGGGPSRPVLVTQSEIASDSRTAQPRLLDAAYQRQRLAMMHNNSRGSRQDGERSLAKAGKRESTSNIRDSSIKRTGSSQPAKEERKRSSFFGKKKEKEKKPKLDEKIGTAPMDKRQKEQKKKMEAELAKKEHEKLKREKEMTTVLLAYLAEDLEIGGKIALKPPLIPIRVDPVPATVPPSFSTGILS